MASIQLISDVQPIEGADSIEKVKVNDWWIVTKKGEFNVNDKCIFFEIDSFLPDIPVFDFLKGGATLKRMIIDNVERTGIRLKTVKLRGQISQGLVLKIEAFHDYEGIMSQLAQYDLSEIGIDISGPLNVHKWEAPIPSYLTGQIKGGLPGFIPRTDEERIQNMGGILTSYYVTEKLDGTSVTYYKKDGVFGVCSRNIELKDSEGNMHWTMAKQLNLPDILPDNMALQGELVGEGIQKNPLKLTGQKVYFYNAYSIAKGEYLDFRGFMTIMSGLTLHPVPIIDMTFSLPNSVDALLKYAEGKSLVNPEVDREGIVVRSKQVINGNRVSFKVISNNYLLKDNE